MPAKTIIFSCPQCGYPYEAYPPDDYHTRAKLEEPQDALGGVIKVIHNCENCRHPIALHWYKPKPDVFLT